MTDKLPEGVKDFIQTHIDSVEQLDILILLYQTAPQQWNKEAIAQNLRSNPNSVARRLASMAYQNLLVTHDKINYSFDVNSKKSVLVTELSEAYRERRYTILNLLFSKPVDVLRSFSDAFKIKKEGDNE